MRVCASSEMWQSPSLPGKISTKQPKATIETIRTCVDFADFDFCGEVVDDLFGFFHRLFGGWSDTDNAVVVDVDLRACLFDNGADLFAARADDDADFARLDLDGFDARRIAGQLLLWFRADLEHLLQDMETALLWLAQGSFHDLLGDPFDFDVDLEGGDAL